MCGKTFSYLYQSELMMRQSDRYLIIRWLLPFRRDMSTSSNPPEKSGKGANHGPHWSRHDGRFLGIFAVEHLLNMETTPEQCGMVQILRWSPSAENLSSKSRVFRFFSHNNLWEYDLINSLNPDKTGPDCYWNHEWLTKLKQLEWLRNFFWPNGQHLTFRVHCCPLLYWNVGQCLKIK